MINPMDICPRSMIGIRRWKVLIFFGSTPSLRRDQFDFYGAEYVFLNKRNFASAELDVALHKLKVRQ